MLAAVATNLGLVVDGIIVGNLLGTNGLSAVNLATPLSQFFLTFQLWLNTGIAMLSAESIGSGDKSRASSYFTFALLCNLAIGIIFLICGIAFPNQITSMLCSSNDLMQMTESYSRVMLLTATFYLLLPGLAVFVRSDGAPRLASVSMIVANVVNLCCDIIFIKYFRWGIAGAAWATALGFAVGVAMMCSHFFSKNNSFKLNFNFRNISFSRSFSIGLAPALWSLLMTLRIFSVNHIVLSFLGAAAVGVFAVCYNMQRIVALFISGTSQTLQPVGSLLIGLGDTTGVKMAINTALKTLIELLVIVCTIIFIFPVQIAGIFGLRDPSQLEMAVKAIRIVTPSFIFFGFSYLLIIVYQLTKRLKLSIVLSSLQALLIIPVMLGLAKADPDSIWWSFLISEVLVFVAIAAYSAIVSKGKLALFTLLPKTSNDDNSLLEFSFEVNADKMSDLLDSVDKFLEDNKIDESTAVRARLCCEELALNVINFGFAHKASGKKMIDIRMLADKDRVKLAISDNGVPFNPIQYDSKTGLGLLLVRKSCDELTYKYLLSENITQAEFIRKCSA
jgi:putative MATE family efflux protein